MRSANVLRLSPVIGDSSITTRILYRIRVLNLPTAWSGLLVVVECRLPTRTFNHCPSFDLPTPSGPRSTTQTPDLNSGSQNIWLSHISRKTNCSLLPRHTLSSRCAHIRDQSPCAGTTPH